MSERRIDISGDGSALRVHFPYRAELVTAVKEIPGRKYHSAICDCGRCAPPRPYWSVPFRQGMLGEVLRFAARWQFAIDERVRQAVERDVAREQEEERLAHLPDDVAIDLGGAEKKLYAFQRVGVWYATRQQRVLIADEPGLGKTVQALCSIRLLGAYPALIICPATLKVNWQREAFKWLPGKFVQVFGSSREYVRPADVFVINYDLLKAARENDESPWYLDGLAFALKNRDPKMIVLDESHYIKTPSAQRTIACKLLAKGTPFRILLSGTPILNRPSELKTQLQILGWMKHFGGAQLFDRLYCGAKKTKRGYDNKGASNLQELNRKLRASCFIRRKKSDVYKQLPAKQHAQIALEIDNRVEYNMAAKDLREWLMLQGMYAQADKAGYAEQLSRITYLKQLAARGKLKQAYKWIDDFLEDSEEKLVVFAYHHEIVEAIAERYQVRPIYGPTSLAERQKIVDDFQSNESTRIIVLNLDAGGVGLTLTAASNIVFLELGWTPAKHEQAEDRCHRIGQEDQVTAWYLVGADTIDEDILELLAEKRAIVGAATDGEEAEQTSMLKDLAARLVRV